MKLLVNNFYDNYSNIKPINNYLNNDIFTSVIYQIILINYYTNNYILLKNIKVMKLYFKWFQNSRINHKQVMHGEIITTLTTCT